MEKGYIIEKLPNETDDEYLNRVIELSLKNPKEAYNSGCATIYISALLSNKLNVRNGENKHEYYYSLKLCDETGKIQNTILPKVSLDEKGRPVFQDPVKIVVRPKYVQGMYNCKSKYDTAPEIVYMPLDVSVLDKLNINVESATSIVDYNGLSNKPKINGIELAGNKDAIDLNLVSTYQLERYVSVDKQQFTEDEQKQARENIGANHIYGTIEPDTNTKANFIGQLYINTENRQIFFCYDIKDGKYYWQNFKQTFEKAIKIDKENKEVFIQHNMNCYPNITIVETKEVEEKTENYKAEDICFADISYIGYNDVKIIFDVDDFSGKVLLNY